MIKLLNVNSTSDIPVARTALFVASLVVAIFSQPLAAEAQSGQQMAPQMEGQATSVNDPEIEAFVTALSSVQEIQASARNQMAGASPEQQANIQEQAQVEMISAVEEAGLSVDRYNSIIRLMGSNPEIDQRVTEEMRSR